MPAPPRSGPARSETFTSLPPYSSPRLEPHEVRRKPVKPSDESGLQAAQVDMAGQAPPWGPGPVEIPQPHQSSRLGSKSRHSSISPSSETTCNSPLSPYGKRHSTDLPTSAFAAPNSGRLSTHSRNHSSTPTSLPSSLTPSSEPGFLDEMAYDRRDSLQLLDEFRPELSIESLQGAAMYV